MNLVCIVAHELRINFYPQRMVAHVVCFTIGAVAKRLKAEDCKSFIPGSNPGGASFVRHYDTLL